MDIKELREELEKTRLELRGVIEKISWQEDRLKIIIMLLDEELEENEIERRIGKWLLKT